MKARGTIKGGPTGDRDLGELMLRTACPCGGEVTVFELGLLHSLPMCDDFEQRDPVAFVRWLRESREDAPQN